MWRFLIQKENNVRKVTFQEKEHILQERKYLVQYMNFNERIMRSYAPLPFFMTYQEQNSQEQEASGVRDFEYLQQTYPAAVRKYQRKIDEILDKLDYKGSMIYDEYPDKLSVIGLADSILKILMQDPELENETEENPEIIKTMNDMVRVLLCNEIYKRRHCGKKGNIFKI